jgi:hypothetical protein
VAGCNTPSATVVAIVHLHYLYNVLKKELEVEPKNENCSLISPIAPQNVSQNFEIRKIKFSIYEVRALEKQVKFIGIFKSDWGPTWQLPRDALPHPPVATW